MEELTDVVGAVVELPIEHLVILVALSGLGLAAFAIYAVLATVNRKGRR